MELNRESVNLALARKQMSITQLAKEYGVSRARINVILNSRSITNVCAGRLAKCLNCDVADIVDL